MNSQINNNDKEIFSEESFRNTFFDSAKRVCSTSTESNKRARLDASVMKKEESTVETETGAAAAVAVTPATPVEPATATQPPASAPSRILPIKRFRSRSLPNLFFFKPDSKFSTQPHARPQLPPVNLQSLREIDLHEILKNPQLRHDIIFDPLLQFRVNLDGERGKRKKISVDQYWDQIQNDCDKFMSSEECDLQNTRLPLMFTTLKDILLSLLPLKDRAVVKQVMDTDLVMQQLKDQTFDFVAMSNWLATIFKNHCAPMRDQWVDEMALKFKQANEESSTAKLVDGLRMVFAILEAMKLDVANHQIRILRPALVNSAMDFEKEYFTKMIDRKKLDISDSLAWFARNYRDAGERNWQKLLTGSILKLLSCRNMCTEFPSTFTFDHSRMVLWRSDIRQLVCLQICLVLYKQLLAQNKDIAAERVDAKTIRAQILAIVTDENGNIKWTRNIMSIALQLVKLAINTQQVPEDVVKFAYDWLMKQTQPTSQIYGLLEQRCFKQLAELIEESFKSDTAPSQDIMLPIVTGNPINGVCSPKRPQHREQPNEEIETLASKIGSLVKFHWSVFGDQYLKAI